MVSKGDKGEKGEKVRKKITFDFDTVGIYLPRMSALLGKPFAQTFCFIWVSETEILSRDTTTTGITHFVTDAT